MKILPGRSRSTDIGAIRDRIGELKAERAAISARPATLEEALARLEEIFADNQEGWKPPVDRLFAPTLLSTFPTLGTIDLEPLDIVDASRMMIWLHGPLIREKVLAAIKAHAASLPDAISKADRAESLARVDAEILAAEREEEARLEEMEAELGTVLPRRPDADPRAVLGVD